MSLRGTRKIQKHCISFSYMAFSAHENHGSVTIQKMIMAAHATSKSAFLAYF
jgi:hypothetical protein